MIYLEKVFSQPRSANWGPRVACSQEKRWRKLNRSIRKWRAYRGTPTPFEMKSKVDRLRDLLTKKEQVTRFSFDQRGSELGRKCSQHLRQDSQDLKQLVWPSVLFVDRECLLLGLEHAAFADARTPVQRGVVRCADRLIATHVEDKWMFFCSSSLWSDHGCIFALLPSRYAVV